MTNTAEAPINKPGTSLQAGKLYARLYHGRKTPDEELDGWGFTGPLFGPLQSVTLTYLQEIRMLDTFSDGEAILKTHDDMVEHEGAYYGDFSVFVASEGETA